jgi:hypothetical protein
LISRMSRVEINDGLLLRAWLNLNPATTLIISSIFLICNATYIVYIFERTNDLHLFKEGKLEEINGPSDYLWLIFISILTVGYGDMYPNT